MDQLNSKEALVLRYITDRINDGVPPTVREICSELSIKSTSTAHKYLRSLEAKGYILMGDRTNRSIRLNVEKTVSVPLIGTVAAGQPILAIEEVEDYIPYRVRRGMGKDLFALRVKGESMVNAAILDGDIIIARRTPETARSWSLWWGMRPPSKPSTRRTATSASSRKTTPWTPSSWRRSPF